MSRKHIAVFAILSIMIMLVLGCQGYEAPKYKSPNESSEGEYEEVEIDVSDLGDDTETAEDDFWADEEGTDVEDTTATEVKQVKPASTTPVSTVTGKTTAVSTYKPMPTTSTTEEDEEDFEKANYKAVVEEDLPTLTVQEGELVKLTVKATDDDGDKLTYDFGSPLNSDGKWQTRSGDAGAYYPEIKVSDGKTTVTKKIKIVVEPLNNKPVLQFIPNIEVNEGETVTISAKATDRDGDRLTYSYSGWMTSSTYKTDYSDSGVHKVTVSVSDGISTVSQEVTVTVKDVNRPPTVEIEF
ncbi:PKD domain-containing protein [Candidatus Woesearchaeota archaeon]|nr:PKD domain-containing protein [Candidatus Woesearchaeota archaeon]